MISEENQKPWSVYKILGVPFASWFFLLYPLKFIARIRLKPAKLTREEFEQLTGGKPVVLVLPRFTLLDVFMVNLVLKRLQLPQIRKEARANGFAKVAMLAVRMHFLGFSIASRRDPFSPFLEEILSADARIQSEGLCLLPVSVFWSRGADRSERNFILRNLFPDDGNAGFFQKLLLLLTHSGQLAVTFGNAHMINKDSVPELPQAAGDVPPSSQPPADFGERARRYRRVILAELNRERTAALGPALYEFSTVANWILGDAETRRMFEESSNPVRSQKKAYHYLQEIAANYNYSTLRAFETVFDFVWTRIFKGVRVRHFESVREVARSGRILWMPCHRSHLDYMLLSYVLFKSGLACPHIAAGVNLSFWPAGPILRRGGAFYIRRSFSGNKLYTRIFSAYVDFLMHGGFPIEFFHEGGRSRIGKLMTPRYGFTNICVRSILRRKAAATYIIPVYIGYDKVMEDDSYAREVSGAKKHKESLWQLLRSVRYLFSNYGRVDVSFGQPIHFGEFWKDHVLRHESMTGRSRAIDGQNSMENFDAWRDEIDTRHPLVQSCVESLAYQVNERINATAVASGTGLMAVVALALTENSIDADTLAVRFEHAAWTVDTLRNALGWDISNSFNALEGSFTLATRGGNSGQTDEFSRHLRSGDLTLSTEAELSPALAEPVISESDDPVVSIPHQTQGAVTAFHATLESCLRWGFFEKIDAGSDGPGFNQATQTEGGVLDQLCYRRSDTKSLNLYWYRGNVFHIFAVPGIAAKIILNNRIRNISEITFESLLSAFDSVRQLWKVELYWPREDSSEKILKGALKVLQGLGIVQVRETRILISMGDEFSENLNFVAGFVQTEKETYGLQIASALQLSELRGGFRRDELIAHAFSLHRGAFLRSLVACPASLTRVYGGRSFDALVQQGIFVPKPGNLFKISYEALQPHLDFFDVAELTEIQV